MMHVKCPVVAGMFYPGTANELSATLDELMRTASVTSKERPHALIAPHAGYQYSGPVAASAYATLAPWADQIRRVVVLAPSHRLGFRGIATSSADVFQTPLGDIPVDCAAVKQLSTLSGVLRLDEAFAQEHALEVQLPFLQTVLAEFELVPLIVGEADSEDVSRVIDTLWSPDTLIVVSSDLSHFLEYSSCQRRDRSTSALIENMQADDIGPYDACGAFPVCGLLKSARRHGWRVRTLDLRNSGDTAGDKSRVVGYGAYEFY
ncbi:MAG: AmmeMemoRadiSam system protein B [Gammaproteobacteria bacterium]|nr:AmmeMemoRadiSam system protein B [Gammaproteobacteria bacterium]